MEGFSYTPDTQGGDPEIPQGPGTLENNDSGKTEVRNDEERKDHIRKLLRFAIISEVLRNRVKKPDLIKIIMAYRSHRTK